jgi:hypothetical protein
MLKVLCFIEDVRNFEYVAVSESGRLATRIADPLASVLEVKDLERVMQDKFDAADPKPEGLAEVIEGIRQFNDTVTPFERLRYVKSMTPHVAQAIFMSVRALNAATEMKRQEAKNTVLNMDLKVVKVEKDGE